MLGRKSEIPAEERRKIAVRRMGTAGAESMKRLNIQVEAIIVTRIREEWKPNAVALKGENVSCCRDQEDD